MYFVEKTKGFNIIKSFDYWLFSAVIALSAIGMIVLKSAVLTRESGAKEFMVQTAALAIGLVLAIIISCIDYKDFKTLGFIMYLVSIGLLVLVLVIGKGDKDWGSRSWIRFGGVGIQPAEVAKIAFILVISVYFEKIKEGSKGINVVKLLALAGLPIGLILLQPDAGTAMVFMFSFAIMMFICGLPFKYIFITLGTALASLPFLWMFVLKPYQKKRILVFFWPEMDPQGSAYHVIQSKRTIGSGEIFGKGLFNGIQTQNGVVPEKQTDFIFTVIGEELGFIGSIIVLAIVFFILMRCIYIAKNSRDNYGSFVVIGLASMMAFHFIENMGMCIGLLPVTGIPLPFISYGGSAMITNFIAVGVLMSVSMKRKKALFNNSQ